jgi:hypothetical protein
VTAYRDIAGVGIDVGKTHHWACMVDAEGKAVSSIKVANDETAIVALITDAGLQATQVVWAIDIIGAPSALLLALLARADQSVRYASGRVVAAMSAAYAGEGKTDCGHSVRGVLPVAGPKDRSASCLLGDTSATGRTPPSVSGRTRCGLIGA